MTYKDILVQLDTQDARPRYEIAARLAARADGKVTGVFLKTNLINQYSDVASVEYFPVENLQALIDQNDKAQDDAAAEAGAALLAAMKQAKTSGDWHKLNGDNPDALVAAA